MTDILKRGDTGREMLLAPVSNEDAITFAGVKFKQTSTAPSVTIGGNTYYNTYIYGDDALFAIFLGKNPETNERNYKLLVQEAPQQGSVSDPARQIGGWVAYNVKFTTSLRPGSTMTIRRLQSETSSS